MVHQKIRNMVHFGDPCWHFEHVFLHKSSSQKYFGDWVLCISTLGEGPLGPLWVELLEVKPIDGVSEASPVRFRQDVCPLSEVVFDDVGSFPQGFKHSWP